MTQHHKLFTSSLEYIESNLAVRPFLLPMKQINAPPPSMGTCRQAARGHGAEGIVFAREAKVGKGGTGRGEW